MSHKSAETSPSSVSSRLRNSFSKPRKGASSFIQKAKTIRQTREFLGDGQNLPDWLKLDNFVLAQKINAQLFYSRGAQVVLLCKIFKSTSGTNPNGTASGRPQILVITMASNSDDWATLALHRIKVKPGSDLFMELRSSTPLRNLRRLHASTAVKNISLIESGPNNVTGSALLSQCTINLEFTSGSSLQFWCAVEGDSDILALCLNRIMHQLIQSPFDSVLPIDNRRLQSDSELKHCADRRCPILQDAHGWTAVPLPAGLNNRNTREIPATKDLIEAKDNTKSKPKESVSTTDHHALMSMSRSEQRRINRMVNGQGWNNVDATTLPKLVVTRIQELEKELESELMAWDAKDNQTNYNSSWFGNKSSDPIDKLVSQLEAVETDLDDLDTWMSNYNSELQGMRLGIAKIEHESNTLQLESTNHARLRDSIEDLLNRYSVDGKTKLYLGNLQEHLQQVQVEVEVGVDVPTTEDILPLKQVLRVAKTLRFAHQGIKGVLDEGDSDSNTDGELGSETDGEVSDVDSDNGGILNRRKAHRRELGNITSDEESDALDSESDMSFMSDMEDPPGTESPPSPKRRTKQQQNQTVSNEKPEQKAISTAGTIPHEMEYGMLSVQQKQQETHELLYTFGSHLDMFLENRIHCNASTMKEAVSIRVDTDLPVIDSFESIHSILLGYAPLVREIRTISAEHFDQVRLSYTKDMGRIYSSNIEEFFNLVDDMVTGSSEFDSRLASMPNCKLGGIQDEKALARETVLGVLQQRNSHANLLSQTDKVQSTTTSSVDKSKLSPAMAMRYSLEQLVPLITREKKFVEHFFYGESFNVSTASNSYNDQGLDGTGSVESILDDMFLGDSDCVSKLSTFVQLVRKSLNNFEMLNMVVDIETIVKQRESNPGDFIVGMLTSPQHGLQVSLQVAFSAFIDDQLKWIDGIRPDIRYCGVLPPFLKFPAFIDHIMAVWYNCVAAGEDDVQQESIAFDSGMSSNSVGNNVGLALQKVATTLLHWVHRVAATKAKYTAIVLMENLYFFGETVGVREVSALETAVDQAYRGFEEARDAYLGWMLNQVFPTLVTFLYEADQILVTIAKSDLIYHKPKEDYKKAASSMTTSLIASGTALLRKRVDKHFGMEANLGVQVLKCLHETLAVNYEQFYDIAVTSYGETPPLAVDVFAQLCLRGLGMDEADST